MILACPVCKSEFGDPPPETCPGCGAPGVVLANTETVHIELAPSERPEPAPCDVAPAPFAGYEIVESLDRGGMGVVQVGRQVSLNRNVAVKQIHRKYLADEDVRRRFLAEAAVTASLNHPNIVPVHDLLSDAEGQLYFSMRLIQGQKWSDVITEKSIPENLDILMRVADAVAYAHAHEILHMDLKPANVMVGEFGEVQIIDWGCAVGLTPHGVVPGVSEIGHLVGTPAYMAPEVAKGDIKSIGVASEVYLLGAILYEIVEGQDPHPGFSPKDKLNAARANVIAPPAREGELTTIALKAMATAPGDRFGSVLALQQALRDYLEHRESYALSQAAQVHLAEAGGDYQKFSRAIFANEEALALWDGNNDARSGLRRAREAYARQALERGDFDLALTVLGDSKTFHALRQEVEKLRTRREKRQLRHRRFARASVFLLLAVVVSLVGSYVWVTEKEQRLLQAQVRANRAEKAKGDALGKALQAGREALRLRQEALQNLAREMEELLAKGDLEQADTCIREGRKQFGEWPEGTFLQGLVLQARGRLHSALPYLVSARGDMPSSDEVRNALYATADQAGAYDTILEDFSGDGQTANLNTAALAAVGSAHVKKRDLETAVSCFQEALRRGSPDSLSVRVRLIGAQLARRNPNFSGHAKGVERDGKVMALYLRHSRVIDLAPLAGTHIETLDLEQTPVIDLTPLKGLPLRDLNIAMTGVKDLSPLQGMSLHRLKALSSPVQDLGPLTGQPIRELELTSTDVTDLAPLAGMPLESLILSHTEVKDLSPLQKAKLRQLLADDTGVVDLSPLAGQPIVRLSLRRTAVKNLSPLKNMPLQDLYLARTRVQDLSPLKGKHLRTLDVKKCILDTEILDQIRVDHLIFPQADRLRADLGMIRAKVRKVESSLEE